MTVLSAWAVLETLTQGRNSSKNSLGGGRHEKTERNRPEVPDRETGSRTNGAP